MRRTRHTAVVICSLILASIPGPVWAQDEVLARADSLRRALSGHPGLGNPIVHRIAENVYAVTGLFHSRGPMAGVNAGIVAGDSAVVFIDCGMSLVAGEFLWELALPLVRPGMDVFLVLTHHHSDHVFGMRALKDRGAMVIAHGLVAEELRGDAGFYKTFIAQSEGWSPERADIILGDVILSVPDLTIEGDATLQLGGEGLQVLLAPGHVGDELAVYHPESRTLLAGDAVYEGMPPSTQFGDPEAWEGWIRSLERLKRLDIETLVPGHGDVGTASLLDENIEQLRILLGKAL